MRERQGGGESEGEAGRGVRVRERQGGGESEGEAGRG